MEFYFKYIRFCINLICDLLVDAYCREFIDYNDYSFLLDKLHDFEKNLIAVFYD